MPARPGSGTIRAIDRPFRTTTKLSRRCSTASSSSEKWRPASVAETSFIAGSDYQIPEKRAGGVSNRQSAPVFQVSAPDAVAAFVHAAAQRLNTVG